MITENETERCCQGLEEDKAEFRLETKRLTVFWYNLPGLSSLPLVSLHGQINKPGH